MDISLNISKPEAPEIKKYDGPTYYIIPLKGMVGKTAGDWLKKNLLAL